MSKKGIIGILFLFPYAHATERNLTYTITQNGVTLNAHIMQAQESSNLFLHNLHIYQICPLELVITNNTAKSLMISGNSIEELSLIPPQSITTDIFFKNQIMAAFTAYSCAITGWLACIVGFSTIEQSFPTLTLTTKYISSAAMLLSFLYQAHRFVVRHSKRYTITQANIAHYGLSGTNIIIDPNTTVTLVMFLNNKSYMQPLAPTDTFYYLFNVKLYNLYDSTDIIMISVEVPKIGAL